MIDRLNAALTGRYRIARELGEGGMATVYLAEDLRHKRKVAIKVLRPELAALVGGERFLGEIETTAKLQHPHILPLFDSGEADGFLFYVMPRVEGESLRERLEREQQLPVEEALSLAEKVGAALQYAHEQGVVHRDVKPANVLLSRGEPLVADFGIALAVSQAGGGRITETGLSLGTPHYMSPEQAAGQRTLDPRSDVYALACVLHETLTGQPPFGGPNVQAVLGRILTGEPDPVTMHRRSVPANVEAAILKALERLPADRFGSAAEFVAALRNPSFTAPVKVGSGGVAPASARRWRRVAGVAGSAAVVAAAMAVWGWLPGETPPVRRYSMELPAGQELLASVPGRDLDLAPDGSSIVYVGPGEDRHQLWLRPRDRLDATPVPGTEGGMSPVFSPDGRRIAFVTADLEIGVVSVGGEPPVTVPAIDNRALGLDWGPDGYLYYGGTGGVFRIPVSGGQAEQVSEVDPDEGETFHILIEVLPGGRGLLYATQGMSTDPDDLSLTVLDLETREVRHRLQGVTGRYARTGHLVYASAQGTLLASTFDPDRLDITGPPVALDRGVTPDLNLNLSDEGTLLYRTGAGGGDRLGAGDAGRPTTPVRVARDGTESIIDPDWKGDFASVSVSPDGSRLAVSAYGPEGEHIWVKALDGGPPTKLTFEGSTNGRPAWTPEGGAVAFYSNRSGGALTVWQRRADGGGPATLLLDEEDPVAVLFSPPDGRWIVYRTSVTQRRGADILAASRTSVAGGSRSPQPLQASQHREVSPTLSPDGRWLAYVSTRSGREEVYVSPFPDAERTSWQVSLDGGNEPLWSRGGGEIFYRRPNGELVAARVRADSTFGVGEQLPLFSASGYLGDNNHRGYDVLPGDSVFVMFRLEHGGRTRHLVVVENFFRELRERVP